MLVPFGLLIGFLASVLPGPIHVFAVSEAMRHGFRQSLSVGLTAAVFDMVYCYIALIGTTLFYSFMEHCFGWLRLISVIVMVAVGFYLFRQARRMGSITLADPRQGRKTRNILMTLLLYISSPTLAAFWIAVAGFLAAHGVAAEDGLRPYVFSICVGAGSLIWYLAVAKYAPRLQTGFGLKLFKAVLTALAVLILGMAAWAFGRILFRF